ncbi:hypothetical protein P0F65_03955 [Sphingomonas sp. I4]
MATLDRWQVRIDPKDAAAASAHPQAAGWLSATVPGSVQQDLIAAKIVPDPYKGANEAPIQWAGLTGWQYRTSLDVTPEMLRRDHLDLVFDGLDTFATVSVNGQTLLAADNAHRRWRADAKPLLKAGANEIVVTFASPIKTLQPMVLAEKHPLPGEYDSPYGDEPKGVQTSPYIRKPKYQYGWDWAPRIVDIGIWRAVRLEAWDAARIDNLRIEQEALTDAEARILARASVVADRAQTGRMDVTVTGPDGKRIRVRRDVALQPGENDVVVPVAITRPQRWQPVGFGAHPLYTVNAALAGADAVEKRTGLRTVELVRKDGSFGLKINGNVIFAKGSNVIPFDAFPARVAAATERQMLEKAVAANMNIVRIWGGGYYPEHSFYDAADELGLMVWQDFMFGGAVTPPTRNSARMSVSRRRSRSRACNRTLRWSSGRAITRCCRAGKTGRIARRSRRPSARTSRSGSAPAWPCCSTGCCAMQSSRTRPASPIGRARPRPIMRGRPTPTRMATAISGTSGRAPSRSSAIPTAARASCPNMASRPFPTCRPSRPLPIRRTSASTAR